MVPAVRLAGWVVVSLKPQVASGAEEAYLVVTKFHVSRPIR